MLWIYGMWEAIECVQSVTFYLYGLAFSGVLLYLLVLSLQENARNS